MANLKKSLFLCLLYYLLELGNSDIVCESGFCRSYGLDPGCPVTSQLEFCRIMNATHAGLWLPSPTICNCCEFCLPFFVEDGMCSAGGPGTGVTVGRCGFGMTCVKDEEDDYHFCRRMPSKCHSAQDEYDERHALGQTGALEERPRCDDKAKYEAFECAPTQTCFCQSEDGERLFGEVLHLGTATSMHCGCSRLHDKIRRSIAPSMRWPVLGPRCTSDGNFNPVQCIDRLCYCVNRITGAVIDGDDEDHVVNLDHDPLSKLPCYDRSLDIFPEQNIGEENFNYTTPCIERMHEKIERILELEEEGFNVDYFNTVPECLPDGTFGRIAVTTNGTLPHSISVEGFKYDPSYFATRNAGGGRGTVQNLFLDYLDRLSLVIKICIDERGEKIEDYEAEPGTDEFNTMDCKCALSSLLMATSNERPVCCKNGNFRKIQCRRGQCRCVDADGRQQGKESVNVADLEDCYDEEVDDWRSC